MKGYLETQYSIHIEIEKPVYGTFVYIRDKYIIQAKKTNKKLIIKTAGITGICTAKEWLKNSEKIKKVYLIPNQPMVMYGNHVSKFVKIEPKEIPSLTKNGASKLLSAYRDMLKAKKENLDLTTVNN